MLKQVKGRWACLFLDFRFYLARKTIAAEKDNAKIKGIVVPFQTKLEQAGQMLIGIGSHFATSPLLVVTDSWFGNESLWRPVREALGDRFHMLSRLRCNNGLYAQPDHPQPGKRGRHRKYGKRLGSVTDRAAEVRQKAKTYTVNLYGKRRDVCAYDAVVMLKTLKRPVRVVWVFRKTQWVAMFSTDLELSVIQIIEYYGARWKIESGFKELKQDIGSRTSQCRTMLKQ